MVALLVRPAVSIFRTRLRCCVENELCEVLALGHLCSRMASTVMSP